MATVAREQSLPTWDTGGTRFREIAIGTLRYLRRNPELVVGLCLILALLAFVAIGHFVADLAVMVLGTPQTLEIGLAAGLIGVTIGTILALVSAFYRGPIDTFIRGVVDIGLTIPGLMVLVTLAMNVRGGLSIPQMILAVACLAWLFPARVIRAQVLSARERAYIDVARLSGTPTWAIIVTEVLPNLMPYIVASLVGSVSAAVLASVGLEVLGLGSFDSLTIGMTLYWVIYYAAIINSWWWWWLPPIIIIIVLFTGLFLMAVGLDELANPRLRRRV
jgi:peptide/nickel transport system permease protein